MSVWNTPEREFDTFRPVSGTQISHAQHASVLLSVPSPTTIHTREEEIDQTYESVPQATTLYELNSFEERFKEIW